MHISLSLLHRIHLQKHILLLTSHPRNPSIFLSYLRNRSEAAYSPSSLVTSRRLHSYSMPVTVVAAKPEAQEIKGNFRFIVNLTDSIFRGYYHGRQKHEDDLDVVLVRCAEAGVESMILTGGNLHESREALELAKKYGFYATIGCHPTRSKQFDEFPGGPEAYLEKLDELIAAHLEGKGRVVAVGECGLGSQLALAKKYHLPLFLHSRAAHADFVSILREEGFGENGGREIGAKGGVVHSFTGTPEEAKELMDMGFHIGLNGCGMKTEQNLTTAKSIRPEKIMFETDSPWCSLTTTHASRRHIQTMPASLSSKYFPKPVPRPEAFAYGKPVKGRNEPTAIGGVAWVVHCLHETIPFERITERAWKNTVELFGLHELNQEKST